MAQAKIGFITSGGGGNPTGIGDYVNRLNNAGLTAVIMCNDGDVGIGDALATGGNHVLLFRVVRDGSEQYSVPDYSLSPQAAAVKHWQLIRPFFHPAVIANKDRVWVQPINEVDKNRASWLGDFGVELARIANGEGYKVAMFAFSSGEPEPFHWVTPGMVRYLQYCEANHEQAAVALHEYDLLFEGMVNTYPWHIGRFEFLYQTCDDLGIRRPLVLITEFGWKLDDVPALSQVIEDLDFAGLVYSQYADVLGAGIWYLGGGHNGIANKVQPLIEPVTNFILTTTYPEPPAEPEPPGDPMPDNLLPNPSFEEGHYNQNGVPELQFPNHWVWTWKTDSGYVRPEFRVQPRNQIPTNEWPLYFVPPPPDDSSWHTLKAFKQGLPIRPTFKLLEALNLPAGKYRFSFWIYPDIHTGVVNGAKQWSNNPDACKIRLFWNGVQGNWQSLHPYGGNAPRLITYEWQHGGGDAVVGFQADMPLAEVPNVSTIHNGIWTDAHDLRPVEAPPPPPPPPTGTFEERLWKASVQEQRTNGVIFNPALGLWKKIHADGLHVVTHERPFEGVNYQVGEKPDKSERWVYTWTAADGIKRFKWPADVPPPPFEFAAYPVPSQAYFITSPFNAGRPSYPPTTNQLHEGVDLRAPFGTPIAAVADGVVDGLRVDPGYGYGTYVRIKHNDRYLTWYGHLKNYIVQLGQIVLAGQIIGYADSTGDVWPAPTPTNPTAGTHLHLTLVDLEQGLDGYIVNKVINPKPFLDALPPSGGVAMPPYFLPVSGDYGDICILKNNWGQNDERQQLQRVGNVSYVTKNNQWERRRIASDGIYLEMDTSPFNGQYYTISGSPWLPLSWGVGDEWLRFETVSFYHKSDCRPAAAPYTVTNKIRFAALHPSWTSAAGVTLNNVIELQWLIGGNVEETYHFAPGKGLVSWANRAGKKSWVTEIIPVGQQGNNQRETGCFST